MKRFLRRLLGPLVTPQTLRIWHYCMGLCAAVRYGFPGHGATVFGITGTKGKSTTAHILASILEEAGHTVGLSSTVAFRIAGKEIPNKTNMSVTSPFEFQRLLREMRSAGCTHLVLEVTSIALHQFRTFGIPFRYAGFTNLTHEHLDYHGSMEAYAEAKLLLLKHPALKAVVINGRGAWAKHMLENISAPPKILVGDGPCAPHQTTGLVISNETATPQGTSLDLHTPDGTHHLEVSMLGSFSVENSLVAAGMAYAAGTSWEAIARGIAKVTSVAGRLESIALPTGATIYIDYAHTPDSLERLYATLKEGLGKHQLHAILGSCGDRDAQKRPIMGALAGKYADTVVVTDEEPYTEDPLKIIQAVASGVPRGRNSSGTTGQDEWWWVVPDRKEAIIHALTRAKKGDRIALTGMGSLYYRTTNAGKEQWHERTIVESLITEVWPNQ